MRQNIKYNNMIHCAMIIERCWEHVIVLSRFGFKITHTEAF